MKNRVFSAITALIMLISCLAITSASAEEYIVFELGNFRGSSKNPNVSGSNISQVTNFGYDTSTNSLQWVVRSVTDYKVENNTDWTDYEEVHIRLYSSETQKINVVFSGVTSVTSGKYTRKLVSLTGGEWQDVKIPISQLTDGLKASDDKKSIALIRFDHSGWSNREYVAGSKIYIDSIYLTKAGFKIMNTQPEDKSAGVDASEGFKYTINFNNALDTAADYGQYISVADAQGGALNCYTVTVSEKAVTLTFSEDLLYETEYTVTVSGDLNDAEGNTVGGDRVFTFTTGGEPLKLTGDGVVFSAASDEDMSNIVANGAVEDADNTFIFDRAARLEYTAGKDKTYVIAYKRGDVSGYTHVNYLIYNPKKNAEKFNMLMYDKNDKYYHNAITTDWTGWKLISVPIAANSAVDPTKIMRFSVNFGAWHNERSEDGYIILGRMWLSDHAIGAVSLKETEYADEAGYVPSNLGGDNRFSFTFDRELEAVIGKIEVSRLSNGEYVPYEKNFTAEVNGNKLDVVFETGLEDGRTYKISIPAECVLAKDFGVNDKAAEVSFTVGTDSPYFRLVSVSPKNGETVTAAEDFTITLTFNKVPNRLLCHEDYISFYKNGDKQFGAFYAELDGNSVVLHFKQPLEAGKKYSVKISGDYSDNFNNKISGDTETVFYTYEKTPDDTNTLFSAGDADNLANIAAINGSGQINNTNPNLNKSNLKCVFPEKKDISVYIMRDNIKSMTGMEYANFWIYAPEAVDEDMNIIFYTDRSSNKYKKHSVRVNWEGWKLVSVALADIDHPAKIDSVSLNFGGWSTPHNKSIDILVDEAWLSAKEPEPPALVSASIPNGYVGVAAVGAELSYEFDSELNTNKEASVKITNKMTGEEFTDHKMQISGNRLILMMGKLDENSEYQVEINGLCSKLGVEQSIAVIHSFKAAGGNVYVSSIGFENTEIVEGEVLTANFEIVNSGSKSESIICKLNLYDENNILISKSEHDVSCGEMSDETAVVSMDIIKGAAYAVAYAVNPDGAVVSDKFMTLKSGGVSSNSHMIIGGDTASLKLDGAGVDINNVSIRGTACKAGNTVILTITDSNNNIITSIPLSADAKGKFTYECRMPQAAESGEYTVTAAGGGLDDTVKFNYVSSADRDELLILSSGSDAQATANWLTDNAGAVGIVGYSSEQIADLAKVFLEQDAYGTYKAAINGIAKITDTIKQLNSCTWAGMGDHLEKNHTIVLGKSNADYTYFAGLSERDWNTILIEVSKSMPAQTVTGFREAFAKAVIAYKNSAPQAALGSSAGDRKEKQLQIQPQPINPPKEEQSDMFSDLGDHAWAKESIEALCARGIIAKADKFRPGDSITREEFIKLIVCAFCGGLTAQKHEFSDADMNAWYNEYLWTAYAEGIAAGYADGRFGVGENITREDMVTIAGRAIEKKGKLPDTANNKVTYSDSGSISAYALKYIEIMSACGVVSGMGDGVFAPKAVTTRAQAAMVIYRLLELTD